MSKGPLAVRWGALDARRPAGRRRRGARASSSRTPARSPGATAIRLAYHWLDDRGNPIVWDGDPHAAARRSRPASARTVDARVRAPIPPGRYRFALDLVAEHRAWFSELGSEMLARRRRRAAARRASRTPSCPTWVEPAPELGGARRGGARRGLRGRRRRDRLGRRLAPAPRARELTRRARAGSRASAPRCSARRCCRASSSSGSPTSRACRRSPRRSTSRGSTTAGSCSLRPETLPRARPRSGRRRA